MADAPAPWRWDETSGPGRVAEDLAATGLALFHLPGASEASRDGAAFLSRILGGLSPVVRTLATLIKPDPAAAAAQVMYQPTTKVEGLLHVDPPIGGIVTPHLQIMVCRCAATVGGDNLVLDMWQLLDDLERKNPAFLGQLFTVPRRIRLARELVYGVTVGLRRRHLLCIHSAHRQDIDAIGQQVRAYSDVLAPVRFRAQTDDVYINDNHRMLHGRTAFVDDHREFQRYTVWLRDPFAAPARHLERAQPAAAALAAALADDPPWIREQFGADDRLADIHQRVHEAPPSPRFEYELDRTLARLRRGKELG